MRKTKTMNKTRCCPHGIHSKTRYDGEENLLDKLNKFDLTKGV